MPRTFNANHIEKYIVIFKDIATPEEVEQFAKDVVRNGGQVFNRYSGILNGFAANIPIHFLSSLRMSNLVEYIEHDSTVRTQS